MKQVLVLSTGGTIVAAHGEKGGGLSPEPGSEALQKALGPFGRRFSVTQREILNLDSSNIQPEEWRLIAKEIYHGLPQYDGVIVTHGTDTMAYTSAAVTFMLRNLHKPVVFTGSQIPLSSPLSDGRANLATAFAAVEHGVTGVNIAFHYKLISGCRAVKVRSMGMDAFASVNFPYRGRIYADGVAIDDFAQYDRNPSQETALDTSFCSNVFLLKLFPGTDPSIFRALSQMGCRGLVLETFGVGGLHVQRRDLAEEIGRLVQRGVAVVVCSQCLYDRSDISLYDVGKTLHAAGVIEGRDMTTEAAVTKLMWALGRAETVEAVRQIFATDYAGEITLPGRDEALCFGAE